MSKKVAEIPKPNDPNSLVDLFNTFYELVKILRLNCPWDSSQTNESIAHLMIEETYEAIDAIYAKDDNEFSKELGDLLLHIFLHSIIAEERNAFSLKDVINNIFSKMVHRHPHVFGDTSVSGVDDVMINWEALKKKEGQKSTLEGVPDTLPALLRAERIQHKVSRVGFDWTEKDDVWNKVFEELQEFRIELQNEDKVKAREELGDFIFAIVNAARHEGLVAEEALHLTNLKFTKRFQYIEKRANELNRNLDDMTLEEMDEIWNEAKKLKIK